MYSDLLAYLKSHGIPPAPPASAAAAVQQGRRLGITIPEDLIRYFCEVNGSSDEYDDSMFRFWSLSQFASVEAEYAHGMATPDHYLIRNSFDPARLFIFADYFMGIILYAVDLQEGSAAHYRIVAICGENFRLLGNSLPSFFRALMEDESSVLF